MNNITDNTFLISEIIKIIEISKNQIVRNINQTMVYTYFEIGKIIVENEQKGKSKAEYGAEVILNISRKLTDRFGKGFSVRNIEQMRQFYLVYGKTQTVSAKFNLSWSHYLKLMRIENIEERHFYEIEAVTNNWSLRELTRQFDSSLYERLALSRDKEGIKQLAKKGQILETPLDLVKDPYILEFIGLEEMPRYSESDIESRLIDNLQTFLLELGKGFTYVGRQVRFTFQEQHFRVDLVFYNRILKSFVLIDLKCGTLKHQDIGQMQMYVNYYDRYVKLSDENSTIGILLCKDKSDAIVEITLPKDNEQIFASKYKTILPSKDELKRIMENNLIE